MKKTSSEKQYSPYPIYLSHQPDRSEPINTSSSARLYQSIPDEKKTLLLKNKIARLYQSILDEKIPSEKHYRPYPIYLSHQPDRSEPINTSL